MRSGAAALIVVVILLIALGAFVYVHPTGSIPQNNVSTSQNQASTFGLPSCAQISQLSLVVNSSSSYPVLSFLLTNEYNQPMNQAETQVWNTTSGQGIPSGSANFGSDPLQSGSAKAMSVKVLANGYYTNLTVSANHYYNVTIVSIWSGQPLLMKGPPPSSTACNDNGSNVVNTNVLATKSAPPIIIPTTTSSSSTPSSTTTFSAIPDGTLIQAYLSNQASADSEYTGKTLYIQGEVVTVEQGSNGHYESCVDVDSYDIPHYSVLQYGCSYFAGGGNLVFGDVIFNWNDQSSAAQVPLKQPFIAKCTIGGLAPGQNLELNSCVIIF